MQDRIIALKVDVDTYQGMKIGVPTLLAILKRFDVRATFFLSFGPDNSGKAVWNIFKKRGFLSKMIRTRAPGLYGFKTLFYGTLLPAPLIALSFPEIVREIDQAGHEIGVHAWDHRLWQDHLDQLSTDEIRVQFEKSFSAYRTIISRDPRATAAPAWYCNRHSLKVQDGLDLDYCSDTRGEHPFKPSLGGTVFQTIQIPSNRPCIEEIIGLNRFDRANLVESQVGGLKRENPNIIPIHAEIEGGLYQRDFARFLRKCLALGYHFWRLDQVFRQVRKHPVATRAVKFRKLPGRSGLIAVPGEMC